MNLGKIFEEYTPKVVEFYLEDVENLGISLHILEKNKILRRTLRNNYFSYDGPSVEVSDLIEESGKQIEIIVKLSQNIKAEKDEESKCKNYPSETFLNFNECDQKFVKNLLQDKLNITPFWATELLDNVTTIRLVQCICICKSLNQLCFSKLTDPDFDLGYYFMGVVESPCYVPCTSTKV